MRARVGKGHFHQSRALFSRCREKGKLIIDLYITTCMDGNDKDDDDDEGRTTTTKKMELSLCSSSRSICVIGHY